MWDSKRRWDQYSSRAVLCRLVIWPKMPKDLMMVLGLVFMMGVIGEE